MASPLVSHDWVLRFDDDGEQLEYAHMVVVEKVSNKGNKYMGKRSLLVAAWQANEVKGEGSRGQHIRFSVSEDEGKTWLPSECAMYGLQALWSPVLFFDEKNNFLYLFYSESRKALSPGGDIKYIRCAFDSGGFYTLEEWEPPKTILSHEAAGGVPKVLANRLVVLPNGSWGLPFWSEPFNSYLEYPAYHPLKELPPKPAVKRPYRSEQESRQGEASMLISNDEGQSWSTFGRIRHKETWLIENPVVCIGVEAADGSPADGSPASITFVLLMLFRTGLGEIYFSTSEVQVGVNDSNTVTSLLDRWSDASPLVPSIPNPNSKICCISAHMSGLDRPVLVLSYNNSTTERSPLDIALSFDGGKTFLHVAVLECDGPRNFAYPDILYWDRDVIKVSYSYWTQGLRLATLNIKDALRESQPSTYNTLFKYQVINPYR